MGNQVCFHCGQTTYSSVKHECLPSTKQKLNLARLKEFTGSDPHYARYNSEEDKIIIVRKPELEEPKKRKSLKRKAEQKETCFTCKEKYDFRGMVDGNCIDCYNEKNE